ncbi:MAG: hypothetical protein JO157_08290 [Acetobacteraceae bacterium]|nr:hypothetical protein [Acetobacteraceae bacterium]
MPTNAQGVESAVIGLALLVFFIVRQFSTRRVLSLWQVGVPLVLAALGLQGLGLLNSVGWVLLAVNLSLGVALGVARGVTFKIWSGPDSHPRMRGTRLTLVLWAATVAVKALLSLGEVRLGVPLASANTSELMLPAAATLGAQLLVVYLRSQHASPLPA